MWIIVLQEHSGCCCCWYCRRPQLQLMLLLQKMVAAAAANPVEMTSDEKIVVVNECTYGCYDSYMPLHKQDLQNWDQSLTGYEMESRGIL